MDNFDMLFYGLQVVLTPQNILVTMVGAILGLIFCCLWMFIAEGRSGKKDSANFSKDELWVILGGFGVFALTFLIGLMPTLLAYLIYWLKGFEKCSWKSTLKVSLIVMTIVIGVFYLWLEVPFPEGLILETLME